MKPVFRSIFKYFGIVILCLLTLVCGLLLFLSVTEYKPQPQSDAAHALRDQIPLSQNQTLRILSWNTGYAGLDAGADFFMDGGTMVNPSSPERVSENMSAIADFIREGDYYLCLLQEVDRASARTQNLDQLDFYAGQTGFGWAYAANYRCRFVPYPLPPIGKVETGIATLTNLASAGTPIRVSLPCPFQWPVRTANLKRCLLVSRYPIADSDKELVVVNLHLEAYDNGEGKAAQSKALLALLESEYQKGNYVIAGGDFNQTFTGAADVYPVKDPTLWTPGILEEHTLPEGWRFVYDASTPSCRLLNQPYDPASDKTQYYIIDGFLVSPNLTVSKIQTIDLHFSNSDHNPVQMELRMEGFSD